VRKSRMAPIFRVRQVVPLTTTIGIAGMLVGAVLIFITFAQAAVAAARTSGSSGVIVFLAIIFLVTVAIPLLAAGGLLLGRKWAPVLVTIFAVWGCVLLISYRDPASWLAAVTGVVAAVAVWTKSSRQFAQLRRERALRG
jgi:uncharacterized membrane protein